MNRKKKKEKVYCGECEFYEFVADGITPEVVHCYEKCNHDNAVLGDYKERNAYRTRPDERNKNNDCDDFKEPKKAND